MKVRMLEKLLTLRRLECKLDDEFTHKLSMRLWVIGILSSLQGYSCLCCKKDFHPISLTLLKLFFHEIWQEKVMHKCRKLFQTIPNYLKNECRLKNKLWQRWEGRWVLGFLIRMRIKTNAKQISPYHVYYGKYVYLVIIADHIYGLVYSICWVFSCVKLSKRFAVNLLNMEPGENSKECLDEEGQEEEGLSVDHRHQHHTDKCDHLQHIPENNQLIINIIIRHPL